MSSKRLRACPECYGFGYKSAAGTPMTQEAGGRKCVPCDGTGRERPVDAEVETETPWITWQVAAAPVLRCRRCLTVAKIEAKTFAAVLAQCAAFAQAHAACAEVTHEEAACALLAASRLLVEVVKSATGAAGELVEALRAAADAYERTCEGGA